MKWICLTLWLSNIALLGWRFGVGLPEGWVEAQPAPQFTLPKNVASIELFSEVADISSLGEVDNAPVCTLVGPFSDALSAKSLLDRLSTLDAKATLEKIAMPVESVFWVYLEPEATRAGARAKLAELQAAGIDSYIIPKGDLNNGISLGVFSKQSSADARLADMQDQGLEPKIQEVAKTQEQLWVMVRPEELAKIGHETIKRLLSEGYGTEQRQNFCLDVASAPNFQ